MPKIRLGQRKFNLPESRALRLVMGVLLIIGGMLGFLPILGFWMIPLGFIVLAQDIPAVRRFNRRFGVRLKRWWTGTKRKARVTVP
jgi:purine-cytosine permease-like protein